MKFRTNLWNFGELSSVLSWLSLWKNSCRKSINTSLRCETTLVSCNRCTEFQNEQGTIEPWSPCHTCNCLHSESINLRSQTLFQVARTNWKKLNSHSDYMYLPSGHSAHCATPACKDGVPAITICLTALCNSRAHCCARYVLRWCYTSCPTEAFYSHRGHATHRAWSQPYWDTEVSKALRSRCSGAPWRVHIEKYKLRIYIKEKIKNRYV